MIQLLRNRSRVVNAAAGWLALGVLAWAFLLAPYAIATYDCVFGDHEAGQVECLKPVAQKLRRDSNIATYATATVAAIIAMQLANRNRDEAARRDSNTRQ